MITLPDYLTSSVRGAKESEYLVVVHEIEGLAVFVFVQSGMVVHATRRMHIIRRLVEFPSVPVGTQVGKF